MDEEMQMPVEERVTSNWEPLKFETSSDYDYLRNAWYRAWERPCSGGLLRSFCAFTTAWCWGSRSTDGRIYGP